MTSPFDIINAISFSKDDLWADGLEEKEYDSFIINRGLSLFPDTVIYANEMNKYAELPKKMQFDFLAGCISKRKRFSKWPKKIKSDDIDMLAKYFDYSKKRASEALNIISDDELEVIRKKYKSLT
jgi:hypothetical protein